MDFFGEQERARKRSGHMVLLFAGAVLGVVVFTSLGLAAISALIETLAWRASSVPNYNPRLFGEHWQFYAVVGIGVAAVILCASLYKWLALRGGGERIARELGGRRIHVDTRDNGERRLLNIVEEMSIATGLARPEVFVLDQEDSINAFAAGLVPNHAVIGVSRGAVETLSRDELQGVIAHEFSHIFNGDMRINLRLVALLHGILVVAITGRSVFRLAFESRRGTSRKQGGQGRDTLMLLLLGSVLWLVGSMGVLFGRMLKAAVSREREFLADAAAVEFTRNPDGIGGALKKILTLGSAAGLRSTQTEEVTHMLFFSAGHQWLARFFSSHPPLAERIRRISPLEPISDQGVATPPPQHEGQVSRFSDSNAGRAIQAIGAPSMHALASAEAVRARVPLAVLQYLRSPHQAAAVAILLVNAESVGSRVATEIEDTKDSGANESVPKWKTWVDQEILNAGIPSLSEADFEVRFSIVQLCIPALRELHAPHRTSLLQVLQTCIEADRRLSLFELGLFSMIKHALSDRSLNPFGESSLGNLRAPAELILSTLARLGATSPEACQSALDHANSILSMSSPEDVSLRSFTLRPSSDMTLAELSSALGQLRNLNISGKKQLMTLASTIILGDEQVTVREQQLFRILGSILECPVSLLAPKSSR